MSSCTPFTNNLNMWSPISSIYFDQQQQYHHQHNSSSNIYNSYGNGGVITQAAASPTLKYTVHDFDDDYYDTDESRYFHHEPVLYPSACIVCGLAHHPVPHTVMNEKRAHETYIVESTPAPNAAAGPFSFNPKKKNQHHHQLNHLKTTSHDLEKRVVSRNRRQGWGIFFRSLFYRWLSVYQNSIRPSFHNESSRQHNVYPVLKSKKKEQRMA